MANCTLATGRRRLAGNLPIHLTTNAGSTGADNFALP